MLKPTLFSPGTELKKLMEKGCVMLPGVYSPIAALAAIQAGAKGLYISGAGVTNAELGLPDVAFITMNEMAEAAARITQVAPVPIIADADTGYGETMNVARAIIELERAGLAGVHLEDQISPKRCGHLDGKGLIPDAQMVAKVIAAAESRRDPNFMIIARTDARGVEGMARAIERANLYVSAGADAIFPEGLASEDEFAQFRDAVKAPLLANMTEFGKTPIIPFSRFESLGYNLVIYPQTAFRVMLKAISEAYEELIQLGTQEGLLPKMRTRAELYELIEYDAYTQRDQKWFERAEGKKS